MTDAGVMQGALQVARTVADTAAEETLHTVQHGIQRTQERGSRTRWLERDIGHEGLRRRLLGQLAAQLAGHVAAFDRIEVVVAVAGGAHEAADEIAAAGHQVLHVVFHRAGGD